MKGTSFFKLFRSLFASDVWRKPPLYRDVWVWLLGHANYKPRDIETSRGYTHLEVGQFVTSLANIAAGVAYEDDHGKERMPSRQTVMRVLQWLESEEMIVQDKTPNGTRITIAKWGCYQGINNTGWNTDGTPMDQSAEMALKNTKDDGTDLTPINDQSSPHPQDADGTRLEHGMDTTKNVPRSTSTVRTVPKNQKMTEKSTDPSVENTQTPKAKKETVSTEVVLEEIDNLLAKFSPDQQVLIHSFWEVCRLKNKTERIADGRRYALLKELWAVREAYPATFEDGLSVTVDNDVPNTNYVKKVAQNRAQKLSNGRPDDRGRCSSCGGSLRSGTIGGYEARWCSECGKEVQ